MLFVRVYILHIRRARVYNNIKHIQYNGRGEAREFHGNTVAESKYEDYGAQRCGGGGDPDTWKITHKYPVKAHGGQAGALRRTRFVCAPMVVKGPAEQIAENYTSRATAV